MKPTSTDESVSYLVVLNELPIVGFTLHKILYNALYQVQVLFFSDWTHFVKNSGSLKGKKIRAVVADIICCDEYCCTRDRLTTLELILGRCPILVYGNGICPDMVENVEKMIIL